MPKFDQTLTDTGYFRIDDLPYQKGDFELDINPVAETVGLVKKKPISGINNILVPATIYSSWTNASDVAYPSFAALVTDLELAFFF